MVLSISDQAMLGQFPLSDEASPLVLMNKRFLDNVEREPGSDFQVQFQTARSNLNKIELFNTYFQFEAGPASRIRDYSKSQSTSAQLRDRSNKYYQQKHFLRALRGYSLAAGFAPLGTPELGLALANRSAIFFELAQYDDCLRDIELALRNGYPDNLRSKLLERQLKSEGKRKDDLGNAIACNNAEAKDYRDHVLFKLRNPNPIIPAAEDCISISRDEGRGRELITTRDVPPGTVLIVETPFTKVLKGELNFNVEHCHHCLRKGFGGIPCSGCVFAMYCSEDCRAGAWADYHQYECSCTPILHLNKTPRFVQLAFRIICKLGPAAAYKLFKAGTGTFETIAGDTCHGFDDKSGIYSSSTYSPIQDLVSHPELRNEVENFSNTMQSLALAHSLQNLTTYFDKAVPAEERSEFRTWLASRILHHFQNLPCNSISLDELKEGNGSYATLASEGPTLSPTQLAERIRLAQFDQYAAGIYGVISLINHSCDPNVTRINDLVGGRVAVVALRGLRAGEPLTTSYTKVFLKDSLAERRDYLRSNYFFLCQCCPCTENWPLLAQLQQEPTFNCPHCSAKLNRRLLVDAKGHCGQCVKTSPKLKLIKEYEKNVASLYDCYQLVLQNKPVRAVRKLVPCLEYFQDRVGSPFSKTFMAQDILKRALDMIVYFSGSVHDISKQ